MSLVSFILKKAAPNPPLETFGRFLFVGPHPDDIEIGAGATAAKLASMGKSVCFLIVTDGRYGLTHAPAGTTPEQLVEIRKAESLASAGTLGVSDVRFLGFSDGAQYEMKDLIQALARAVGEYKPDVILAPDPNVRSECHQDHLNTGHAVRQIACFAAYPEIMKNYGADSAPLQEIAYYMTARPNQYVRTRGFLEKQLSAIFDCHLSQFPKDSPDASSIGMYLKLRSRCFGLKTMAAGAEGFRVYDQTHMHCLSEAEL